jgi:hypothetical protein
MFVGLEFGNPGLTEPLKLWLISRSDRIGSNDSSQHCAHNEEKELIRIPRNQSYKNDLFYVRSHFNSNVFSLLSVTLGGGSLQNVAGTF